MSIVLLQLFINQGATDKLQLFECSGERFYDKQESHTVLTSQLVERHLKTTLLDLTSSIFGEGLSVFLILLKTGFFRNVFCLLFAIQIVCNEMLYKAGVFVPFRARIQMGRPVFPIHSSILGAGDQIRRRMAGSVRLWRNGAAIAE